MNKKKHILYIYKHICIKIPSCWQTHILTSICSLATFVDFIFPHNDVNFDLLANTPSHRSWSPPWPSGCLNRERLCCSSDSISADSDKCSHQKPERSRTRVRGNMFCTSKLKILRNHAQILYLDLIITWLKHSQKQAYMHTYAHTHIHGQTHMHTCLHSTISDTSPCWECPAGPVCYWFLEALEWPTAL